MQRFCLGLITTFALAASAGAATVDGIPIHYSTYGDGPATLVFVHGWTCDETSWDAQVEAFDGDYRVVTLDLPGHGQSGSPADADALSIALFARAVESVRTEIGAGEIVLVGHSMGVPVIREYARRYPGRVEGLVPVDGPLSMPAWTEMMNLDGEARPEFPEVGGPEGLEVRETMVRGMFTPQTPAAVREHVLEMMLGTSEATAVGAMQAMADPGIWSEETLEMPVLAVYAGTSGVPEASTMRSLAPRYESAQLAGTGHFLMMEKPARFNELLTGFLGRLDH